MEWEFIISVVIAIILAGTLVAFGMYKASAMIREDFRIYTSGADMRRLGTEFTGTNQGTSSYVPNAWYRDTL